MHKALHLCAAPESQGGGLKVDYGRETCKSLTLDVTLGEKLNVPDCQ